MKHVRAITVEAADIEAALLALEEAEALRRWLITRNGAALNEEMADTFRDIRMKWEGDLHGI